MHGIKDNIVQRVSIKRMEKIIKKEIVWAASIFMSKGMSNSSSDHVSFHLDIQILLDRHSRVFEDMSKGLPPYRGFQHVIELEIEKN